MPRRYTHDPNDSLDYGLKLAKWLDGDSISTATVDSISPATVPALSVGAPTNTATIVSFVVSGGLAGTRYAVTIRVTTSAGNIRDFTFTFDCRNR